jgi:putative transposase
MANGRRFRILNIVDDVTRECLAAIPDTSISGMRVARELTDLIARCGKPGMIVSDNGTESLSSPRMRSSPGRRTMPSTGTTRTRQARAKRVHGILQWAHAG